MDLSKMTRKEMLELADKRGLEGLSTKDKATIRSALENDFAKEVAEADAGKPSPRKPKGAPKEAVPGVPLTAEQQTKLVNASRDQIEAALGNPELPTVWRDAFRVELDRRVALDKTASAKAAMTTDITRYVITKGGPFVHNGNVTQVRTGGVVSELSHNLKALAAQGIEYKKLEGKVVTGCSEMGRSITRIVDAPQPAAAPTGDIPEL